MHQLTIPQAKEAILFNALQMNTVTFVWGQFGVGKSDMMRQIVAERPSDVLIDFRLSQYQTVDLKGMPDREKIKGTAKNLTVWDVPGTLPFVDNPKFAMHTDGIIWLFLDEANSATQDVQGTAYQLTNDRCVGEHVLLPNVRIVMAGNREGIDKGVVTKQPLPLSNRVNHFELVVSVKAWLAYQQMRSLLPALAYAYYNFRPASLNNYDPSNPKQLGVKTVATPRTSERMWDVYVKGTTLSEPVRNAIMAGWVGEEIMADIASFGRIYNLIKDYMPEIRRDPATCMLPRQAYVEYAAKAQLEKMPADAGLGLQCAVTIAISGELTAKNIDHLYQFLDRLPPEYCIMAMTYALENKKRGPELYETGAYLRYCKKYQQAFTR